MKILGAQIALDMASRVAGAAFDQEGRLASLDGDARLVFKNLIDEYMLLSEPIVHTVLCNLVGEYPDIAQWYNQDLGRGRLQCPYFLRPAAETKI